MYISHAGKKEIVEVFNSKKTFDTKPISGEVLPDNKNEFVLVWYTKPQKGDLPTIIVTDQDNIFDLFAWASSYLNSFLPITAFTRVMTYGFFNELLELEQSRLRTNYAWVGAIIGESLESHHLFDANNRLSLKTCLNSKSFIAAKSYSCGYSQVMIEGVLEKYDNIKHLDRLTESVNHDNDDVYSTINMAIHILGELEYRQSKNSSVQNTNVVFQILQKISEGDNANKYFADSLDSESIRFLEQLTTGTREYRIDVFYKLCIKLNEIIDNAVFKSFSIAYCLSLVAPGSFEYISLAGEFSKKHPGILIWYGVFSGIHPDSRILEFSDSLGRKILRDIESIEGYFLSPKSDISFEELKITTPSKRHTKLWTPSNYGQLNVEFAPMITMLIKWEEPSKEKKIDTKSKPLLVKKYEHTQDDLFDSQLSEANINKKLDTIIRNIEVLTEKVGATTKKRIVKKKTSRKTSKKP